MDGRVQLPVLNWILKNYPVDFVDVITKAGMDNILASQDNIDGILRSINISININKSTRLFIVGHYDCRGNPVDEKTHHQQIIDSVKRLKTHLPKHEIIGLWVNDAWQVKTVS
jgi:carbonic anhydrase